MGELAALTAAALWAMASMIFARLGRAYAPVSLNLVKCAVALALMVITLLVLDGHAWPPMLDLRTTGLLAVSGVVGLTIGDTAYFGALRRIGARRTLVLAALVPPTTAILAIPVVGETVTWSMAAGMLLTVGGVIWVVVERTPDEAGIVAREFSAAEKSGLLLGLVAVLCQSTGNVLTKAGAADASALGISIVRLAFALIGLVVVVTVLRRTKDVIAPFRERAPATRLLVATFLGTYLGVWLLNAGLKFTEFTGTAATLSSTSPIFILPLAYFVEGEPLTLRSVLGACIAVAGIAILFVF